MFILQCALVGILYYISNLYSSFGGFIVSKYMLQRPLVGGLLCGLIFGDVRTGLEIGVALQLAFMGVFAVGGAISMDVGTIAYPAGAVAIINKMDAGTAIAMAGTLSVLASYVFQLVRGVNVYFCNQMRHGIEDVNYKKIFFNFVVGPQIFLFLIEFILGFVFVYYGAGAIDSLMAMIPEKLLYALGQFAKVLPAVGMAMLLKYNITNKWQFAFFVFGFMLFSVMGLSFIAITIFAVVLAYMYFRTDNMAPAAVAAGSGVLADDDDEEVL